MTDIVDRLRNDAKALASRFKDLEPERIIAWEAAAEIERLRARLVKYQTDETMVNQELKDVRAKAARTKEALSTAAWRLHCVSNNQNMVSEERAVVKDWANDANIALATAEAG